MTIKTDNADVTPLFVEFRPGMRRRIAAAVDALFVKNHRHHQFE